MSDSEVQAVPPVWEPSFTWRYTHALDKQFRVQCPSAWRPEDPNVEFMLVAWPHHPTRRAKAFLMGLTPKRYREMQIKLDAMSLGEARPGALRRAIFEDAIALKLDSAGRFCLPKELCEVVGLSKDVFFVGGGSQFQIWEPELYKECRKAEADLAADAYNLV